MNEVAWVQIKEPCEYGKFYNIGEVIAVQDQEMLDYFISNDLAEIMDIEVEQHLEADRDFLKFGVEHDEEIWVFADIPIHLGTNVAKWKR